MPWSPAIPPAIHHAPVVSCPSRLQKKSATHRFFCRHFQIDTNCKVTHTKSLDIRKVAKGGSNTNVVNRRGCRRPFAKALKRFPCVKERKKSNTKQRTEPRGQRHRLRLDPPTGWVLVAPWQTSMESRLIYFSLHYRGLLRTTEAADLLPSSSLRAPNSNHWLYICLSLPFKMSKRPKRSRKA